MSTRKLLSIAGAAAILVSGVNALEIDGETLQPSGSYIGGQDINLGADAIDLNISDTGEVLNSSNERPTEEELLNAGALLPSKDLRGDALIYPYFRHTNGWGTEITVRNTTPHATVAKAVLYRNDDSMEMIDFNIYLSPFDSATFTIKDNKITVNDRSFAGSVTNPGLGASRDNIQSMVTKETQLNIGGGYAKPNGDREEISEKGYVIIYGMAQHNDGVDSMSNLDELDYHRTSTNPNAHEELWRDYRKLLDVCRDGWREPYAVGGFEFGSMIKPANRRSPNVSLECNTDAPGKLSDFGDVAENTLTGTVKIYKADGKQSRDLRLPATALRNFTSNNMMLWTEGEWAAMHDRRLLPDGKYNAEGIKIDARTAFYTKSAYFTFEKDSVANKLIVTQPMKRTLMQLLGAGNQNDSLYWEHFTDDDRNAKCSDKPEDPNDKKYYYSHLYGGFNISNWVVDNDEMMANDETFTPMAPITSPYTVTLNEHSINCEVAELGDKYFQRDENLNGSGYAKDKDGFAYVNFTRGGQGTGLPAIVTQMTGSKVGGIAQTNWIYAPTIK